jgi:hypothetical protein
VNKPAPDRASIAYRWALDSTGYPVPINAAKRGQPYSCPLCKGQMIPRLGEQLQHHYGHESDVGCTSEAVTRAALRRWIAIQLRDAIAKQRTMPIQWQCVHCGKTHQADLLEAVTQTLEGIQREQHYGDVAMDDAAGNDRAVILIEDSEMPLPAAKGYYMKQELFVLTVPASVAPANSDFASILGQSKIVGAPCPMLARATNIVKEPEQIRHALRDVVSRWPGYFYGPLETVNGLANVLRMGNRELWLPPDHWREVIGGTKNPLGSNVHIIMQSWTHPDGGQIWLYYAQARETAAVGLRRFGPGQTPTAYLDGRFRHRSVTALDMIKALVHQ